jgi:hypothetical protein
MKALACLAGLSQKGGEGMLESVKENERRGMIWRR